MKTMPNASNLSKKELKDLKVLALFTSVYCKSHHGGEKAPVDFQRAGLPELGLKGRTFCTDCSEFLVYAMTRRIKCPLDPKPTCKHCHVHCYRPGHRDQVREIMRFSGKHLIKRGRLDLLWHYFF